MDQTRHIPALKQYLKLYTSISLTKLAGLMDMDSDNLSGQLQVLKVGGWLSGQGLAILYPPLQELDLNLWRSVASAV